MACNSNCNCRNGQDALDFLTPAPGGTDADATYICGITHNTCGGRNLAVSNPDRPVIASLTAMPVGEPISLGNATYCQECKITGTVTYCPCGSCTPQTEYVSKQVCLPCSAATSPTITIGEAVASPKPVTVYRNNGCGCCQSTLPCTKQIAITTSINVTTA